MERKEKGILEKAADELICNRYLIESEIKELKKDILKGVDIDIRWLCAILVTNTLTLYFSFEYEYFELKIGEKILEFLDVLCEIDKLVDDELF